MRDSDIDVIVSKVTEHFASCINSEQGMDEFQKMVAEDTEREIQYLDWKRHSHAEHVLKIVLWWLLGVVLVMGIVSWTFIDHRSKKEESAKRDARWEQEKLENEQFNKDFADVVDLVYKRDVGIYDHLIGANRKLLSVVESMCESGEEKSGHRKKLEDRMLQRLKREIHHCELTKSRIEFKRDNSPQKARWLDFEVFASRCDCHDEEE